MTLPINAPQSIFAEFAKSDNSQNVPPLASEALDVEWKAPVFQNNRPIEVHFVYIIPESSCIIHFAHGILCNVHQGCDGWSELSV